LQFLFFLGFSPPEGVRSPRESRLGASQPADHLRAGVPSLSSSCVGIVPPAPLRLSMFSILPPFFALLHGTVSGATRCAPPVASAPPVYDACVSRLPVLRALFFSERPYILLFFFVERFHRSTASGLFWRERDFLF